MVITASRGQTLRECAQDDKRRRTCDCPDLAVAPLTVPLDIPVHPLRRRAEGDEDASFVSGEDEHAAAAAGAGVLSDRRVLGFEARAVVARARDPHAAALFA